MVSLSDVEEDSLGQHPRVPVHARTWGPPQAQEIVVGVVDRTAHVNPRPMD